MTALNAMVCLIDGVILEEKKIRRGKGRPKSRTKTEARKNNW